MENSQTKTPETPPAVIESRGGKVETDLSRSGEVRVNQLEPVPVEPLPIALPVQPIMEQPPLEKPRLKKIESVMADGLSDTYQSLDPARQKEFREVGEKTASQIDQLLQAAKVQVKKIIDLIISWLKIIPGVNHYYLEQEAKIKADELIKLRPSTSR